LYYQMWNLQKESPKWLLIIKILKHKLD
jgi:hypothetical protein